MPIVEIYPTLVDLRNAIARVIKLETGAEGPTNPRHPDGGVSAGYRFLKAQLIAATKEAKARSGECWGPLAPRIKTPAERFTYNQVTGIYDVLGQWVQDPTRAAALAVVPLTPAILALSERILFPDIGVPIPPGQ